MPRISIIIPAYNCEGTIEKCILSVINQGFFDWELILIDDGSTDNTREICEHYADSVKIFLYSQQNSGVSSARNYGIKKATGEYLVFVDSDDFLLQDALSTIHDSMKGKDICFYNYQIFKLGKKRNNNYISKPEILDITDFMKVFPEMYLSGYINPPWGKCYKKSLITEKFEEGLSIGEDLLFNLSYLKKCRIIGLDPREIYGYQEAISNSLSSNNKEKIVPLQYVYGESMKICNDLFSSDQVNICITAKYIVDQLIEIEKKIRHNKNYRYSNLKNDISFTHIDKLCCRGDVKISDAKWKRAARMIAGSNYYALYVYLVLYKILGRIKYGIRKN